jgi:hypothetical protein
MSWDLVIISIKKDIPERFFATHEERRFFKEAYERIINIRANTSTPYSQETFDHLKKYQGIFGAFEITDEILATIQVILDLRDYQSSWDRTLKYPHIDSPLLRDCPELKKYLDRRYNIFNTSEIEFLGDFEFGYQDFTFNIHPFVPYEFNRKIHGIMDGASEDIKKDIWLAFQTGTYIPRSLYLSLFFADYYRGSKFSKSILENKDSVIEHWRHDEDKNSIKNRYRSLFFKKGLKRTEFMWSSKGKTKDFVIEEIIVPEETEKIDGENYICVKYIHTQFSLASGNCIHFDGCMNIYDSESYQIRSETNINKRSGVKAKKHMKLFRIDGESVITNDEWILLAGAFFKDNELVQEYFGNELPWQE